MTDRIWFQKYRIIRVLGRGGSADVYLAEHIRLNTLRAIKQISKENILHGQLIHEAHILKNLKHPCIPVIYDFEEDAHHSYIIEQYIEGESLTVYRKKYGHLSEDLIINFAIQICDLLLYLYSADNPILYLDLKPDNIIVADKTVKLVDFGACSYKNHSDGRQYSLGTKGFAAPELYGGALPDERADIYGIGTLIYYVVTGRNFCPSSKSWNARGKIIHCSRGLCKILEQCLRSNPVFRYPGIPNVKKDLLKLNRKGNSNFTASGKSLNFAVAGTQHRIGTTHLALLLSSYFNAGGRKGLYIEKNESGHTKAMLKRYPGTWGTEGICRLHDCRILPGGQEQPADLTEVYRALISDYGCIKEDNLEEFLKADIKIVVAGAKEWELEETEAALRLLEGYPDIKYLFNFLDGKEFRRVIRSMDRLLCYRIPYVPNPFAWNGNRYLDGFIKRLLHV